MQHRNHLDHGLARLGWDDGRTDEFASLVADGLVPGRVSAQQRGSYSVLLEGGEAAADLAGRLRHEADAPSDLPAVGDWVAVDPAGGAAVIRHVLERRTALVRKAAGRATAEQVLAANVDVVLVVDSLDGGPNRRRLERYLAAAWESGAEPVVVLTKADLNHEAEEIAAEVGSESFVRALAVSAFSGDGTAEVAALLADDRTGALVGPSGAGKSTLVNRLLGEERQETGGVRDDGRGRHTTTHRELFVIPSGGVVVDTPGLRELGLLASAGGVETGSAFPDVEELAAACRFADCAHEAEPGCAVQAAIAEGRLSPERLASWRKLEREARFHAERHDARAAVARRRAARRQARSFRRVADGPWGS